LPVDLGVFAEPAPTADSEAPSLRPLLPDDTPTIH
jgi:hypothetical protein